MDEHRHQYSLGGPRNMVGTNTVMGHGLPCFSCNSHAASSAYFFAPL